MSLSTPCSIQLQNVFLILQADFTCGQEVQGHILGELLLKRAYGYSKAVILPGMEHDKLHLKVAEDVIGNNQKEHLFVF
jgi:hypothetical protein